jgi:hypothetical protein
MEYLTHCCYIVSIGANYTVNDFVRIQLYRDISVYAEVARRAKIVCGDMDATIDGFLSVNQWAASAAEAVTERRRLRGYLDKEDRKRHLLEVVPSLTDAQLNYVASGHETQERMSEQAAACAPDFTTYCLFKNVGTRFNDDLY